MHTVKSNEEGKEGEETEWQMRVRVVAAHFARLGLTDDEIRWLPRPKGFTQLQWEYILQLKGL